MALFSLGKVTVASAGTPQRATKNESDSTARFGAQAFSVTALAGNSGTNAYVGSSGLNKSTLAGVYAIIPKGSTFSFSVDNAPAGINMAEVYIDVDTNDDAVLVSGVIQ